MITVRSSTGNIKIPKISLVAFNDFDLYRRRPSAAVKIDKAVFCLIGANGLGKSTFLNTIIYGLTGGVPFRARGFQSPREYYTDIIRSDRRKDYFGGRLSEDALLQAKVHIRLDWPDYSLEVSRSIYGEGGVTSLKAGFPAQGELADACETDVELDTTYKKLISQHCGLKDFNQFVFLMHFVCLFDEDRHLLLWEPRALTNALYLAFGSDYEQAARATELQRSVERYSSRARNNAFAARKARESAMELQRVLGGDEEKLLDEDAAQSTFDVIANRLEDAKDRLRSKESELSRANAAFHDSSAKVAELQLEYNEVFASRALGALAIAHHPLVQATLHEDQCGICMTHGVAHQIQSCLDQGACPLCGTKEVDKASDVHAAKKLKFLDQEIQIARGELDQKIKLRRRLQDEYDTASQAEFAARSAIEEFLKEHPYVQKTSQISVVGEQKLNDEISRQIMEADRFMSISREDYRNRDKARKELLAIERVLKGQFDQLSDRFVELFRSYAENFIGLQVDIELEHRQGKNDAGFVLLLSLDNQVRSDPSDVSESQRFFLEIALRMALAEFMSQTPAMLLIDTPEGSLDISYEARAGQMFSMFAKAGNTLLITANLRSSALLKRLAERQKHAGMQLERMTDWTDLSDVQREEEALFRDAYDEIERALA